MTKPAFCQFSGAEGKPTAAERRLIAAAAVGQYADCSGLDGDARTVSAALIVAVVTGTFRHPDWPYWSCDSVGLRLKGAVIPQAVSLERQNLPGDLAFTSCEFSAEVVLLGARIDGNLKFSDCRMQGSVQLDRAIVNGVVDFKDTVLEAAAGICAKVVHADAWLMDGATIKGCFDISRADISGPFSASKATFEALEGNAIFATGVKAAAWCMDFAKVSGGIDLSRANISGEFIATNVDFHNPDGRAILAEYSTFSSWCIDQSIIDGGIDLSNSKIDGLFSANGSQLKNRFGEAIFAYSANFDGGMFLKSATIVGGFYLHASHIKRFLVMVESNVKPAMHRAIGISECRIEGTVSFRGADILGHIHANRAIINGRLSFERIRISASSFCRSNGTLPPDFVEPDNPIDVTRQHQFRHHAISMHETFVAGRLVMPDECPKGIVDLSRARCDTIEDSATGWPEHLARGQKGVGERETMPAEEGGGRIDIQHLVLDGFEYRHWKYPAGATGDTRDIAETRIKWLAGQSARDLVAHLNPQPWLQAATIMRAMGYDEAARTISVERRIRQRHADGTTTFQTLVSWFLHRVADYGFNPWKTVTIAAGLAILLWGIFCTGVAMCGGESGLTNPIAACGYQPVFTQVRAGDMVDANTPYNPYPPLSTLVYSIDTLLPFPDLGMDAYWRPNTDAFLTIEYHRLRGTRVPIGWLLYIVSMLEAVAGAILIAIAVTGFTGLLTRDEK